MDRVMIFIDGSNFYHGCKRVLSSAAVDFEKFAELLCDNRQLRAVYYYNAPVRRQDDEERYRGQQRFLAKIQRIPYFKVKLGRLVRRAGSFVEKGVDLTMAMDMLLYGLRDNYDVAILVSGDGDFAALADAIGDDLGKHIENAYFLSGRSQVLENACHRFIELTPALMQQCMI